ncbi:MAG: hypothetical protein NTZ33_12820 [Bacteroidetes bacterium]|nr:hypothetical protein [Bacteroidota bacterium]
MDRRSFVNNIARVSILIGIGAVSGKLLLNENSSANCDFQFVCSKCKKLTACSLPEATRYKEVFNK